MQDKLTIVFSEYLDLLITIYNGLVEVSEIVVNSLSSSLYDNFSDVIGLDLSFLPAAVISFMQDLSMLDLIFGGGFAVIVAGIIYKWFKEFIF